jgi:hypothetical protein
MSSERDQEYRNVGAGFYLWLSGFLMSSAWRSLYEDFYGKERFLRIVDAGWISAWITVPYAVFLIFASFWLIRNARQ